MPRTSRFAIKSAVCALLGASLLLVTHSAEAQRSRRSPEPTTFANPYFTPTNGRVGYHMVSNNAFAQAPCVSGEKSHAEDFTFTGALPPGIEFDRSTVAFSGTPRQAGDWGIMIMWKHMSCIPVTSFGVNGPVNYGDLGGRVTFHIDP